MHISNHQGATRLTGARHGWRLPSSIAWFPLAVAIGCSTEVETTEQGDPSISFGECPKPELVLTTSIVSGSRCGTYSVAEDPQSADGRVIPLKVMVIPAVNPKPKADPVFFLAGGPGQAASEVGPMLFLRLAKLRKDRDIVLVDQRGTGSSNPLDCEMDLPEFYDMKVSLQHLTELQVQTLKRCLQEYDADPRFYTTPIAMDDLDAVRRALGYGEINLIGGSYGTRAALVYMRRHPDNVRSVVLDGVVPLTMKLPYFMARDAGRALELMLDDCEQSTDCSEAFPQLRSHLDDLFYQLSQQPAEVTLTHPRTGDAIASFIQADTIMRIIRAVLYSGELASLLPLAIEQAYQGNFQSLATMAGFFDSEQMGISIGMMNSVLCSEDMSVVGRQIPTTEGESSMFGMTIVRDLRSICEFWPKGTIPDSYFEPVASDIPVLLTSGELDPVTPPVWGEEAAATLSRSKHIVVAGVGHGTLSYGCMQDLVAQFIDQPNPQEVVSDCLEKIHRPPFFYSTAGPVPKQQDD
ncbi:MAG: alpha/beta hydrolase [Pseudomonadales bacterium]|nr:alpha/beta hydrolase [Pseudomonadales bacterium]MDP7360156.1 alpha/beta hydrolase [Pseudomonadales bacterium]MDP7595682.1 alpha/beta hydrolase [Pseudomonadales bacterium]HJN51522.1 alpha/beta hydrolase [Pseudomonadales bacterium]